MKCPADGDGQPCGEPAAYIGPKGTRGSPVCRVHAVIAPRQDASHTAANVSDVADLEQRVAAMRRLGVTKWGDIELGPEQRPDQDDDKVKERSLQLEKQELERRERLRFAASGGPRFGNRPGQ